MFATVVLLVDALVGERGLVATMRARRQSDELGASVSQVREENARLRELADRLETDPTTIESVAREKLGLVRPGEDPGGREGRQAGDEVVSRGCASSASKCYDWVSLTRGGAVR